MVHGIKGVELVFGVVEYHNIVGRGDDVSVLVLFHGEDKTLIEGIGHIVGYNGKTFGHNRELGVLFHLSVAWSRGNELSGVKITVFRRIVNTFLVNIGEGENIVLGLGLVFLILYGNRMTGKGGIVSAVIVVVELIIWVAGFGVEGPCVALIMAKAPCLTAMDR